MDTTEAVRALLDELPDNPDGIARWLERLEIQGVPENAHSCPLACYLSQYGAVPGGVWVYPNEVETEDGTVELGGPVTDFIWNVDDGLYPELIVP